MSTPITKKRLLLILELLYKHSDEDNPVSTTEITEYLNKNGLSVDRKTLKSDLDLLIAMDYDIVSIKSSPKQYFWGSRTFEIPELKLLIDAVSSSRFITKKKSDELIKKISSLASDEQAKQLKRHIVATGRAKTDNKKIYYIVDTISDAINHKKKIQFKYTEYNEYKEKVLRHDGEVYTISPYVLYWNEDYYYIVGYSEKRDRVVSFRVDRLYEPKVIDELAKEKPDNFDINDYADKIFKMYSGEETVVELECENSLMKHVIDRFGIDIETEVNSKETFIAKVSAELSPTFYSWVFQFGGQMKILGPNIAVEKFRTMISSCL